MKLFCASLCFILVLFGQLSDVQSQPLIHPEYVRVRLYSAPNKVSVDGLGLQFQSMTQVYRMVSIPQGTRSEVRVMEKEGKKFWVVRTQNQDPEKIFTDRYLMIQGSFLRVGAMNSPSKVILSHDGSAIDVIGVLPLDEYVTGVLASEMPLSWPLETLKAQAVAARSYALSIMQERKNKAYHLESSILDQVFKHVTDDQDEKIKKAVMAVKETRGLKLVDSRKKVLKAFFHSDCGGKTTAPQNVWRYGVNAGTATDSSCPTNPKAQWRLVVPKTELAKKLGVDDILGLSLLKIPAEKRVKAVLVAINGSAPQTISANDFRQRLGFQDLRSAVFEVKKNGDQFIFEGQGNGHGVGLCQWGSRALGLKGKSFKEILAHYYPLAMLE